MEVKPLGTRPFQDISSRDGCIDLDVVELDGWGRLWAPETLAEFIRVVQRTTWRTGQPEVWRGQSKAWPLHSGGARRFRDSPIFHAAVRDPEALESFVADYERVLVDHARLDGHGEIAGRRRSDLEVLGLLQHHGVATRLIDFSLNCLIALWFACRDHLDDCGVVIGLDLSQAKHAFRRKGDRSRARVPPGPRNALLAPVEPISKDAGASIGARLVARGASVVGLVGLSTIRRGD